MHFIKQQQKYNAFTGADILIIYIPKKDGVYYLIFRSYLCLLHCVYYIQLDNRDLQSCQVTQGKDVAIIAISKSTLCTLGHQAVPRLISGLDLMWHTSTILIGEEFFDFCCLGSDCLAMKQWNHSFPGQNCPLVPPTWAIMRDIIVTAGSSSNSSGGGHSNNTMAAAVAARKCHCHHAHALGMIPATFCRHAS